VRLQHQRGRDGRCHPLAHARCERRDPSAHPNVGGGNGSAVGPYQVYKVNAAGTVTQLGSNTWSGFTSCSEIIVSTRDTRSMSLITQSGTALGNTDTFTAGAVANINANQAKDTSPDYLIAAGQVQQYQATPAPPAGSFSVISVVQHARVAIGSSGPTKIDFMVRAGGSDFLSADLVPGSAWSLLAYSWDTNPYTGNSWSTGDLSANSTAFNFGYKSIA
jgi:hypothetical protein